MNDNRLLMRGLCTTLPLHIREIKYMHKYGVLNVYADNRIAYVLYIFPAILTYFTFLLLLCYEICEVLLKILKAVVKVLASQAHECPFWGLLMNSVTLPN